MTLAYNVYSAVYAYHLNIGKQCMMNISVCESYEYFFEYVTHVLQIACPLKQKVQWV